MNASDSPTVLVLGASGRFGAAACEAFSVAGWQVIAQARSAAPGASGGANPDAASAASAATGTTATATAPAAAAFTGGAPTVRTLRAGLADLDAICAQARGAGVVVYAVNPPYTAWPRDALPLLRQGIAIAERLGARLMIPGNVYNFGDSMPELLREDTPQRAATRKGRIRIAMEAELEAAAARGLRSVVLRAGDFFGGGRGTWLDLAIARSLPSGRLVYPGPLDVPHAWAFLPDLAAAFVALARRDDLPAFARLHFAGHTLTGSELLEALQRAAGSAGIARPPRGYRISGMPWRAIRAAGLVVPMARELAEMAYLWRVPHALDGSALRALAGDLRATPIDDAMRSALRTMGMGARPAGHPIALA